MDSKVKKGKLIFTVIFILLLVLCAVFAFVGYFEGHFDSEESFKAYLQSFGIIGPVILTVIQCMQVILPVLPGFLGCMVGSALFGITGGFLCNYIGISLGSLIAFILARKYGVAFVKMIITPQKYEKYVAWVEKKHKSYIIVLWLSILLPLAPDDFLCYFSGLTNMSFKKFAWIIITAKPWCILAYSIFFANPAILKAITDFIGNII